MVNTEYKFTRHSIILMEVILSWVLVAKVYFFSGYRFRELAVISIAFLAAGISFLCKGPLISFMLVSFVFSARGISYKKICRLAMICFACLLVIVVLLSFFGITGDAAIVRTEAWGRGNIRHTLGFSNPNGLGLVVMMIIISALLAFREKLKLYHYLIMVAATVLVFVITDSKSALACSLLAIVLVAVTGAVDTGRVPVRRMQVILAALYVLFVVAVYVIIAVYNQDNRWMYAVNVLTSDRINISHMAIADCGLSFFGQWGYYDLPIDCLFAYAPIRCGIFFTVAFLALYLFATLRAAEYGRYEIAAIAVVLMIYSLLECATLWPFVNLVVYCAAATLGENRRIADE